MFNYDYAYNTARLAHVCPTSLEIDEDYVGVVVFACPCIDLGNALPELLGKFGVDVSPFLTLPAHKFILREHIDLLGSLAERYVLPGEAIDLLGQLIDLAV